jgi:competence ComEA-like helix-hairpin-helix protein
MKPLSWKTAPQRIGERPTGFLVLLLILFLIHLLKPAPYRLGAEPILCKSPVYVQIEGQIRYPGVYSFCDPPTLRDLIRKAGGLREGNFLPADVPLIPSFYKISLGLPISVNKESEEGLTALPGVGKNMAKAIVEERAKRGGFKSLDEIMGIPGIGPKFYVKMKPHLTL